MLEFKKGVSNKMENNKYKLLVRESNALVGAIDDMTLLQLKCFILCLKEYQKGNETFEFSLNDLYKEFNIAKGGNRKKQMLENLKSIHNTSFQIYDEDAKKIRIVHIFDDLEIEEDTKSVIFSFRSKLKPYLDDESFALLDYDAFQKIKSKPTAKLYALIKRSFSKVCSSCTYEVETLKKLFNVSDKYEEDINGFMKRLIIPAINEINRTTDVLINYKTIKEKNKIKKITFYQDVITSHDQFMQDIENFKESPLSQEEIKLVNEWYNCYKVDKVNQYLSLTKKFKNLYIVNEYLKADAEALLEQEVLEAESDIISKSYPDFEKDEKTLKTASTDDEEFNEDDYVEISEPDYLGKYDFTLTGNSLKDEKIILMHTLSPIDYILKQRGTKELLPNEKKIIKDYTKFISAPVFNAILYFSLIKYKGAIVARDIEYWASILNFKKISEAYYAIEAIQEHYTTKDYNFISKNRIL